MLESHLSRVPSFFETFPSVLTARPRPTLSVAVFAALATVPLAATAQQPTRPDSAEIQRAIQDATGETLSQVEILERLRRSGLTRAQVRARLQRAGYDPTLADAYYDGLEGGRVPDGAAEPSFLSALVEIGLLGRLEARGDSLFADSVPTDSLMADSALFPRDSVPMLDGLAIFGHDVFLSASSQFDPILAGPVDAGYRLGPGDELALVLTGDVELAYALPVTREGNVFVPDVGRVPVVGLTLGELRNVLYTRLGQVYSGVRRGAGATTTFEVSLGRLRVNQVFVVGEARRPGAYNVSAAATAFHALYRAGGPAAGGSMRSIEIRRGPAQVATVDLYRYMLAGDAGADVRLDQGDRVFVPVAGSMVGIEGAVRRPAMYELLPDEGIRDLVGFAGGFAADAVVRRIQIDRVVPPAERTPGVDRVLLDVDLADLSAGSVLPLRDGDRVRVFAVSEERRRRVVLEGEVNRPGLYQWNAGETLGALLERAEGLTEAAYLPRAHIYRLDPRDGSRALVRVPLAAGAADGVRLQDGDSVVVYSREALRNESFVSIDGFVKEPGEYQLAAGMSLQDLVLAAGGFARGAYPLEVEVARATDPARRDRALATVFRASLPVHDGGGEVGAGAGDWSPGAEEFVLMHGDRVFVRRAPGYELSRTVAISGEVRLPGVYVLTDRNETLSSILRRAGGMTEEAYPPGFQLIRAGELVAAELSRALGGDPTYDVVLVAGDSMHVPAYDATVLVQGAVAFETRVLHRPGGSLDYYIEQAGGYTEDADRDLVSVTYLNGSRATKRTRFLLPDGVPVPGPGSVVVVPRKPPSAGINYGAVISQTLTALTAVASLIIAVDRISK